MTAFAEDIETSTASANDTVISVFIPSAHTLTVKAPERVAVLLGGQGGDTFSIERLSSPTIKIEVPDDQMIVKVMLNSVDITNELIDGQYKFPPVYEDLALEVETKAVAELTISTTEPTMSTTETTTSSSTDSTSSKTDILASNDNDSESDTNTINPNGRNPDTGDVMALRIGILIFFLSGTFFIILLMKSEHK